eukprot:TRINITY_DN1313_c0_g5_i3.p1 TRINITY_DN1313_c0_g5~~TRINITY_DN1313_c0_g5_i3.p1  ORF type:complete len:339 (+),score=68.60 TRINITY_DN1313_c0_g5_i3:51-1067(+)
MGSKKRFSKFAFKRTPKRKKSADVTVVRNELQIQKPTMHVVDASNWVHTSFHAIPETVHDIKGQPTNAVMGFTNELIRLMERLHLNTDMIALAFDSGKTWRNSSHPSYKSGRKRHPTLLPQIPLCHEAAVQILGKQHCLSQKGMEADDIIAELAVSKQIGYNVTIHAKDQDLFQLVQNGVTVESRRRQMKLLYGIDAIRERFGVEPHQLAEYWALVGQPSDSIKGVDGVGPVKARDLLVAVGSLNAVWDPKYRDTVEKVCGERTAQKVLSPESREAAFFGKRLMQLPSPEPCPGWILPPRNSLQYRGPQEEGLNFLIETLGIIALQQNYKELCEKQRV